MGKVKWSVSGKDIDSEEPGEGYEVYEGPVPPAGVYTFKPKFIRVTEFSSGNSGLKLLLILDPKGDKAKKRYAGAPLFDQLVDLPQNAWKLRQFMDAIGASGKDWDKTITDSEDNVTKFGSIKVADIEEIKVATRTGANDRGDPRMEVARYLPLADDADDDDDDDDDDEEYDDDEDTDADDDDADEDDDSDDDSDDEDEEDDDEDDDDDDEPEPPARGRRASKSAPAKKAPARKAAPAKSASKKAAPAKASKKAARRRSGDDAPF